MLKSKIVKFGIFKGDNMNDSKKLFDILFDNSAYTELFPLSENGGKALSATAYGEVNGLNAYAFCQNSSPFSVVECEKLIKLYKLAIKTGSPIFGIYSSEGVDLNEGFKAFSAYSELLNTAFSVSGVVPQISVIAGPCLGVASVICNTADVVVGVKDTDFYASSNSSLNTGSAEEKGIVDMLADNAEQAVELAKKAAAYLPQNNLSPLPEFEFSPAESSNDIIASFADEGSVTELKKGYAENVVTAFATIGGTPCGIVRFNGKALCPSCAYKAEAFIKLCDAYNLPIITVADSEGFSEGNDAQLIIALTKLASAYSNATCPKISLITKEAVGGAFILLAGKGANADVTLAWKNAVATPLPVDSAVAFMFSKRLSDGESREALADEYRRADGSVLTAAKLGSIDDIINPEETRNKLIASLNMLSSKRETTIPRKHTVK